MKTLIKFGLLVSLAYSGQLGAGIEQEIIIFFRGDINGDNSVNISDASLLADYLFSGADEPDSCEEVWDVDSSGSANIADVNFLFNYLFAGGPAPDSDSIYCVVFAPTEED